MNDPAPIKSGTLRSSASGLAGISLAHRARGRAVEDPGAHWHLEMGTLAESVNERPDAPAVLFEDVPIPAGLARAVRIYQFDAASAITLGFPVPEHPLDVVRAYRDA